MYLYLEYEEESIIDAYTSVNRDDSLIDGSIIHFCGRMWNITGTIYTLYLGSTNISEDIEQDFESSEFNFGL